MYCKYVLFTPQPVGKISNNVENILSREGSTVIAAIRASRFYCALAQEEDA